MTVSFAAGLGRALGQDLGGAGGFGMLGSSLGDVDWERDGIREAHLGEECPGRSGDRTPNLKSFSVSVGAGSWIDTGWGGISGCWHHCCSRMAILRSGEGFRGCGIGLAATVLIANITAGRNNQPFNLSSSGMVKDLGGLLSWDFWLACRVIVHTPLVSVFLLALVVMAGNVGNNPLFTLLFWLLGVLFVSGSGRALGWDFKGTGGVGMLGNFLGLWTGQRMAWEMSVWVKKVLVGQGTTHQSSSHSVCPWELGSKLALAGGVCLAVGNVAAASWCSCSRVMDSDDSLFGWLLQWFGTAAE